MAVAPSPCSQCSDLFVITAEGEVRCRPQNYVRWCCCRKRENDATWPMHLEKADHNEDQVLGGRTG
jgi:hypothetical protein